MSVGQIGLALAEHPEERGDPERQGRPGHRLKPPGGKHQRCGGGNCGRSGIERGLPGSC